MPSRLHPDAIIACLKSHYNLHPERLTPILGGADLKAAAFLAEFNGSAYFIKISQGTHQTAGLCALSLMKKAKIKHLLQPIASTSGEVSQRVSFTDDAAATDYSLVVFPFVTGENGFIRPLQKSNWADLGATLRKIHDLRIESEQKSIFRTEDYSDHTRALVRTILGQMNRSTHADKIARATVQLIQNHQETILNLALRAEGFALNLISERPPEVLCHGDLHAGNILISDNQNFYIVDWDLPILAPKERDLMFIGGGIGGTWNQKEEESLFYQSYGPTQVHQEALAYYRCERILVDFVEYAQALVLTRSMPDNKLELFHHFSDIFRPGNVVEIALRT